MRNVPNVRKAVRWNSPFYGIEGQGWFLGFRVFTHYLKLTFFRGTSLEPVPPGGTGKDARWIDIPEDELDEAQLATWIKQAASIPTGTEDPRGFTEESRSRASRKGRVLERVVRRDSITI